MRSEICSGNYGGFARSVGLVCFFGAICRSGWTSGFDRRHGRISTIQLMEEIYMENCSARHGKTDEVHQDSISDMKSSCCQLDHNPVTVSEVICPQPRRPTRVAYFADGLNRLGGKPYGFSNFPAHKADSLSEILYLITSKDEAECDSDSNNQSGYFCGSPPLRTSNPVIHDAEFTKKMQSLVSLGTLSSAQGSSPGMKQAGKLEIGSAFRASSMVGTPKVRTVGFSCGNSDSNCVLPTLTA